MKCIANKEVKQLGLQDGDRNTQFFHAKASTRQRTNTIDRLKNDTGRWLEELEDIRALIMLHFTRLFQFGNTFEEEVDLGVKHILPRVDEGMAQVLSRPFTEEEVTKALFQMSPLKSPSPDGMAPTFFQFNWHVVNRHVLICVLNLLHNNVLPDNLNATNIMLIPKLKPLLDSIVSPTQAVFFLGRLITDNALVAYELNHLLKNKKVGEKSFMALKLDTSESCDKDGASVQVPRLGFAGTRGYPDLRYEDLIHSNLLSGPVNWIAQRWGHHQLRPPARNRWQHPPADSTFNSLDETGIGVVARDSSSACLAWISRRIYRPVAPLIAEAIAAREAISFAIKSGRGHLMATVEATKLLIDKGKRLSITVVIIVPLSIARVVLIPIAVGGGSETRCFQQIVVVIEGDSPYRTSEGHPRMSVVQCGAL
ncbi:hypothetical protein Sango_1265300 [Sesamum angolense]|uniref:RNase H type-1 domain-containing protein n=1 Tax=Sesamum angolense TaxID=2727404 RepID=A0AAE1WQQ5_9LAMI|nr:hypothetical protein Sango_1265300 [Sesamum angolense]